MPIRQGLVSLVLLAVAGLVMAGPAQAQRAGGRYQLEYEGALTGGVTGSGAVYSLGGGALVIELPPVIRSYPSVRLRREAGLPDRPVQIGVGRSGAEVFTVEFTHPELSTAYVAEGGSVRITDVVGGRLRGEFTLLLSPVARPGAGGLTLRGRFEALAPR